MKPPYTHESKTKFDTYCDETGPMRARHGFIWDKDELKRLSMLYDDGYPTATMCALLQRPKADVLAKLKQMGCISSNEFTGEYTCNYKSETIPEDYKVQYKSASEATEPQYPKMLAETKAYFDALMGNPVKTVGYGNTTTPTPETENTMSTPTIETKTFIYGRDGATMTDEEIFKLIQKKETEVNNWLSMRNRPEKLLGRLADLDTEIKALVKYVDTREVK